MSGLHFDSQKKKQQGKPDAGKLHVRFDEGEASRPLLGGNLSTLLKKSSKHWNQPSHKALAVKKAMRVHPEGSP